MSVDTSIFGKQFNEDDEKKSYDYIEKFISDNVKDWTKSPDTDALESAFSKNIGELDNSDFAFLLSHSGYIPEIYEHDSSQETLYSKLIESLVCEWAKRLGFDKSTLQKQKSNKEDVAIMKGEKVIVCDAKSFRLGRSQAAPNVKDTIKKSAYTSWLKNYKKENRIGGLVVFPSLHNWQKNSEAYKYFTEGNPSIMLLFYEQMAFMLLNGYTSEDIVTFMNDYKTIFPLSSEKKEVYAKGLFDSLFAERKADYEKFMKDYSIVIKSKVTHVVERINSHLDETKNAIEQNINAMDMQEVKQIAIDSSFNQSCGQLIKQKENILKFRPHN